MAKYTTPIVHFPECGSIFLNWHESITYQLKQFWIGLHIGHIVIQGRLTANQLINGVSAANPWKPVVSISHILSIIVYHWRAIIHAVH